MEGGTRAFWDAVRERWRAPDPQREEEVVLDVLGHLARRLPGPEAQHLKSRLPAELRAWPELEPERRRVDAEPQERFRYADLVFAVADKTGFADPEDADAAVRAVLRGVGRMLDARERCHIAAQLPADLRAVWEEQMRGRAG